VGIIFYAWHYRKRWETSSLIWLLVTVAGWLTFNTAELVATSESQTLFWAKICYPFIAMTPLAWLLFALRYTGQEAARKPRRLLLYAVIPAITALLALTNEVHRWLWWSYTFTSVGRLLAVHVSYGPWFWVHLTYSYLLIFIGAGLIIRQYFKSFHLYRAQSLWLVIGALIPIVTNLIYVTDFIPPLQKDYTPISFALAGMVFAVGMFRYHLFDLQPVARDVVLERMSDAVMTVDLRGRVVDQNPAAQSLGERMPETLIGQPLASVIPAWETWAEALQTHDDFQADFVLDDHDDSRAYEVRISALFDPREKRTGWVVLLHEITERKKAEEALQDYAEQLAAQNAELDAFAHTVAHDIKTPLSVVLGYARMLTKSYRSVSPDALYQSIQAIEQSGEKINIIIDELLLLAGVRKQDVKPQPLEMAKIVQEACDRLQPIIDETEARISQPDPTTWPVALGHAPWVEEVWVNYISNALKYGGRPDTGIPPRVELGYTVLAAEAPLTGVQPSPSPVMLEHLQSKIQNSESSIVFWVRDNGPGFTPEAKGKLFAEFTRLDQIYVKGHGLGLSIVRRIVEKLSGTVGVESEPGTGSHFYFTLPRSKMPDSDVSRNASS